jgi:hypothetical protein
MNKEDCIEFSRCNATLAMHTAMDYRRAHILKWRSGTRLLRHVRMCLSSGTTLCHACSNHQEALIAKPDGYQDNARQQQSGPLVQVPHVTPVWQDSVWQASLPPMQPFVHISTHVCALVLSEQSTYVSGTCCAHPFKRHRNQQGLAVFP